MSFDPSRFSSVSVIDTCSIWNMLSSQKLYQAAVRANLYFCTTSAVLYECLHKPRGNLTVEKKELIKRFRKAQKNGVFPVEQCSLEDLINISSNAPGRLGSGELSCIATAYKIRSIAFMTDEKLARKYAKDNLLLTVETTPRLYGFLHFRKLLIDSDHPDVLSEHERFESRPLSTYLTEAYHEALRVRLMLENSA